jgi:DNA (cytosine-5)-methyltransferase 1
MTAYYNENDPFAAQWLRNLIAEGLIADGHVDDRDIRDVRSADLRGYRQAHFFAGIGGWSCALRLAGWPDDRPVWTGSCPCQPFSAAGKRQGTDDPRHLWPVWFPLIQQCRPAVVFGEQVDRAAGVGWLDSVFDDLEAEDYACGAAVLPAASVGAPHRRNRLWFVAYAQHVRRGEQEYAGEVLRTTETAWVESDAPLRFGSGGAACSVAYNQEPRQPRRWPSQACRHAPEQSQRLGAASSVANNIGARLEKLGEQQAWGERETAQRCRAACSVAVTDGGNAGAEGLQRGGQHRQLAPNGLAGFWSDCEWIECTDGKARPVEPGSFPLAHGIPGRVGKLRAYGNAIVPQVAAQFIKATMRSADD